MDRWEYLEIWASKAQWWDSVGRSGKLPESTADDCWPVTPLLNELGDQGWEVVGIAADGYHWWQQKLLLKRPAS